ncbi:uroporphyrinogen-III C-methyltransferase [Glaesserella parasuis]|uniref:uroporphyrinogen-III C-methyltransferase n=1 Tax=Glaesserella parasuis TaxID=738 RepID=UPI0024366AFC|nr:uroporphyrinogen-III C-methyltransferase [Glaesserella parasuis]MDG6799950.1 uroporphyrinogen-III C-methyltransferase [Glaesserella parasuis]
MSKQSKKPKAVEATENVAENLEPVVTEDVKVDVEQAVVSEPEMVKETEEVTAIDPKTEQEEKQVEIAQPIQSEQPKQSSGGKALSLLAILIALGVGATGYFFDNQKFAQLDTQIQALQAKATQNQPEQTVAEIPNFDEEKVKIAKLTQDYQQSLDKIAQLENAQTAYTQQINALQSQIQKLGATPKADQSEWLLSDADFLLNNALRKVVLDNDIDTARSLLIEADNVLSQVSDNRVLNIREAIKQDLSQLASVNNVDQNNLMQRLTQLANLLDDMPMIDNTAEEESVGTGEVSNSVQDWQQNLEKSANSFLNHFIRISDKATAKEKAFVAPNQEIYLRENIRLRLQIGILAIPRQQNELYKQSLEAVSTWVRSYFDVQNEQVKTFLKEIDEMIEQSIYIDAPNRLHSLGLLDQLLNKAPKPISKIQLEQDKSLEQATPAQETPTEAKPATEQQ